MGGVIPNGAAGVNTTDGFMLVSANGHGDLSITDLPNQDEPTVRAAYGAKYVTNGDSVLSNPASPLAQVFAFLPTGLSLPLAIVARVIQTLFSGLTGGTTGGSQEGLTSILTQITGGISAALGSVGQLADLIKQIGATVQQVVTSSPSPPTFDFMEQAVNAFQFWTLGWFGYTQQANSSQNPAIVATNARQEALNAALLSGGTRSGFKDHFDRPVIGADWSTHGSYPALAIVLNQTSNGYLSSGVTTAGHYTADHFITDNWHLQFTFQDLNLGASRFAVGNSGFTNGIAVQVESFTFGVAISVASLSAGLGSLGTTRTSVTLANGVFKAGDVVEIEYIDADNTFYVFHNDMELTDLRWEDTGHTFTHDTSHGEVGVMVNVSNTVTFPGPGMDDMSGYDIQVA
jgi:hypothetical protein